MLGKSQGELAESLGVTAVTVGKWELKKSSPTLDNLIKWSNELGYEIKIIEKES